MLAYTTIDNRKRQNISVVVANNGKKCKSKKDCSVATEQEEYTFLIPTPQSLCQFKKWAKTTDERDKIERG